MTSWWERVRDQGVFVSRATTGTGEISACLTRLAPDVGGPGAYPWDSRPPTASGLMWREWPGQACGRFLLVQVEASGQLVCRWRSRTGDQDDNQKMELGKVNLPVHLKLTRTGREIRVFASPDGRNWGAARMAQPDFLDAPARAGLFVCSGNTFASTTAVFESVAVTPLPPEP
jgi:hypothetical protein